MQQPIEETYFGWQDLPHSIVCAQPVWEIDVRRDTGAHPLPHREDLQHDCPNPHCDHAGTFPRVTVRLICRSCDTVHLISGEDLGSTGICTTQTIGYGARPRQMAGLYLWPGPLGAGYQVYEYLVSARPVGRLRPKDCVGQIGQHPTARGPQLWWARAIRTQPPVPGRLDWQRRTSEQPSLDAAAEWIAAALTHTTLEVHV